jgi:hypothetical protein
MLYGRSQAKTCQLSRDQTLVAHTNDVYQTWALGLNISVVSRWGLALLYLLFFMEEGRSASILTFLLVKYLYNGSGRHNIFPIYFWTVKMVKYFKHVCNLSNCVLNCRCQWLGANGFRHSWMLICTPARLLLQELFVYSKRFTHTSTICFHHFC